MSYTIGNHVHNIIYIVADVYMLHIRSVYTVVTRVPKVVL
jgi:hypothetical protein